MLVGFRQTKLSKQFVKTLGCCSAYDIIQNNEIPPRYKVSLLRHRFVFYESNYDLFHLPNGKPNAFKNELNSLLYDIVNHKVDAGEMAKFNKRIMEARKHVDVELANVGQETATLMDWVPRSYGESKYKRKLAIRHGASLADNDSSSVVTHKQKDVVSCTRTRVPKLVSGYAKMIAEAEVANKEDVSEHL